MTTRTAETRRPQRIPAIPTFTRSRAPAREYRPRRSCVDLLRGEPSFMGRSRFRFNLVTSLADLTYSFPRSLLDICPDLERGNELNAEPENEGESQPMIPISEQIALDES